MNSLPLSDEPRPMPQFLPFLFQYDEEQEKKRERERKQKQLDGLEMQWQVQNYTVLSVLI